MQLQGLARAGVADRGARLVVAALLAGWLAELAFAALLIRPFRLEFPLSNDFISFWTGAALVRDGAGDALFDVEAQSALQHRLWLELAPGGTGRPATGYVPYYNPPPMALLLVPLTLLPLPWAYAVWLLASLLAFVAAVAFPLRGAPRARMLALAMLTFPPVASTFLVGQVSWFLLLALSLGMLALVRGWRFLGGALLGLLWLKPQYAVLLPLVFLAKGRWRELFGMAGGGAAMAILSLVTVGAGGLLRYLELLREIGAFYPPPSGNVNPQDMMNYRGLLTNLAPGVAESTGSAMVVGLGAATGLISLLAWKGRWDAASPRFPLQMLVLTLATLIASPHSHFYGSVLLLAPLALAIARSTSATSVRCWRPMLAVGYALALVVWPFTGLSWLLVPYSLVAMGVLISHCRGCRQAHPGG